MMTFEEKNELAFQKKNRWITFRDLGGSVSAFYAVYPCFHFIPMPTIGKLYCLAPFM